MYTNFKFEKRYKKFLNYKKIKENRIEYFYTFDDIAVKLLKHSKYAACNLDLFIIKTYKLDKNLWKFSEENIIGGEISGLTDTEVKNIIDILFREKLKKKKNKKKDIV